MAGSAKTTVRSDGSEQSVYNELRRLILMGELEPGAEISQLELADRLRVSRTPCVRRCGSWSARVWSSAAGRTARSGSAP